MKAEILIIDDEADIRDLIAGILHDEGYETRLAGDSESAERALSDRLPGLVILDVWLKGSEMDGLALLEKIKRMSVDVPVLMISGHGTFDMAVSATKLGAQDFLSKPFKSAELLHAIERALKEAALLRENNELRRKSAGDLVPDVLTVSSAARDLAQQIKKAASVESRLFIWGERGVGKETVARQIHHYSGRGAWRLQIFNCGSLSSEDMEASLLGLEADARVVKIGPLETAHNGVLVLEDVDNLPLKFQARLSKILHVGAFVRAGGDSEVKVNVRTIAISSFNPEELLRRGVLQSDFYHRLCVQSIFVPPLRSRREDIEPLFHRFIHLRAIALGLRDPSIDNDVMPILQAYDWPGNCRQLKNIAERLLLRSSREAKIDAEQVESCLRSEQFFKPDEMGREQGITHLLNDDLRAARHSFEKEYLRFHLVRFDGNISRTAQFVGMERTALHRKLKSLDLL